MLLPLDRRSNLGGEASTGYQFVGFRGLLPWMSSRLLITGAEKFYSSAVTRGVCLRIKIWLKNSLRTLGSVSLSTNRCHDRPQSRRLKNLAVESLCMNKGGGSVSARRNAGCHECMLCSRD